MLASIHINRTTQNKCDTSSKTKLFGTQQIKNVYMKQSSCGNKNYRLNIGEISVPVIIGK